MQPSAQTTPSPNSQSFRGLLASLASPANSTSAGGSAWSDEALKDDVVTLTYEQALRAHARLKPADRGEETATQAAGTGAVIAKPVKPSTFELSSGVAARATVHTAAEFERRAASVTIRLSHAERTRLRLRAAEAGMTVSAYLRSSVLEADALRAEVKQALAEMRTAGNTGTGGTKVQGTKGPGEQVNKGLKQRRNEGIKLTRVLAHIGRLFIGLCADK